LRVPALGIALVVPGSEELVHFGVEQAVRGYQPKLATSAGEVTLTVPKLRQRKLKTASIQRYKRARGVRGLSTRSHRKRLLPGRRLD